MPDESFPGNLDRDARPTTVFLSPLSAAHELGMAAAHEVPAGLRKKLPLEFKRLGLATHQAFDDLARDADSLADANHALRQLGQVMPNCVSYHAMYRLEASGRSK
ncbi:MAG: hypothetical protein B7Y41_11960 [Hydrogenophilales bacterium 28-61-23]|nr:MAG: hypothetical protein B7Y41_11960 [Hydrogenophilales bacterium 28-61-23]